jgi:uncharacterized protein (DUF1800 family)
MRSRLISLVAAALWALGGTACSEPRSPLYEHVLSRTGYGPDAASLARLTELGVFDYLEEQLHPERIDDRGFERELPDLPHLTMSFRELREVYDADELDETSMELPEARNTYPATLLREVKLLRSVLSRRQLEAVLTDFWFDHFNVVAAPDQMAIAGLIPYERDAIRPHVLGRFEDMLIAVGRSPAMLNYLDNDRSSRDALNENYARELLELHTVGVDAGYVQSDVVEVARAFTGWKIDRSGDVEDGFVFDASRHDGGRKKVMRRLRIPAGGGIEDGLAVLGYLASHPATARRVARLLIQRFVDEDPPPELVEAAANTYLASEGDLRATMRSILLSPEFLHPRHWRKKVKRPLVFVASMIRASRGDARYQVELLRGRVGGLGEVLYRAVPPTGFPDESSHWLGGGGLLMRFDVALALANDPEETGIRWDEVGGTPGEVLSAVTARLLPGGLSPSTRAVVLEHLEGLDRPSKELAWRAMLQLFMSPEFMLH